MLLDKLAEKHGAPFERQVWSSNGKLAPSCRLFLVLEDGMEAVPLEDFDREVTGEVNLFFLETIGAG